MHPPHQKPPLSPLRKSSSLILLHSDPQDPSLHCTLLLLRKSTMSFSNSYVFPGGACEDGDRVMAGSGEFGVYGRVTALREFLEETGLLVYPSQREGYVFGQQFLGKSMQEIYSELGNIWKGYLQLIQPVLRLMTPQFDKGKRYDCLFHICKTGKHIKILNLASLKLKLSTTPTNINTISLKTYTNLDPSTEILFDKNQSAGYILDTPANILRGYSQHKIQLIPPQIIIFNCLVKLCTVKQQELDKFCTGLGTGYYGAQIEPIMFKLDLKERVSYIFGDYSYKHNLILQQQPQTESRKQLKAHIQSKLNQKWVKDKGIRRIQLKQPVTLYSSYPQQQKKLLISLLLPEEIQNPKL